MVNAKALRFNKQFNSELNRTIIYSDTTYTDLYGSELYFLDKKSSDTQTNSDISKEPVSIVNNCDLGDMNYLDLRKIIEFIITNYLWKYPTAAHEMIHIYFNTWFNKEINYQLLNKLYIEISNKFDIPTTILNKTRGINRVKSIQKVIDLKIYPTCYLDIGCFDGNITEAFGNEFNLNKMQVHGADIKSYNNYERITFSKYDGITLPYSDNSFDIITCLMILHHIPKKNLFSALQEINRVLKPNGVLILREHDVNNSNQCYLLDIMHDFYDYVWGDVNTIKPEKSDQWSTNYKNNHEWTDLLKNIGIIQREIPVINKSNKNPYFTYTSSYIKKINIEVKPMVRILSSDTQREIYQQRTSEIKTALHWGQRKLLLSEIEFLTIFITSINDGKYNKSLKIYVVYAGSAPGTHILYLSKLFPNVYFELYDPREFCYNITNCKNRIKTHVQYFTDETANEWKSIDHPDKIILFISDIRTGDTETMNFDKIEERVLIDNQWQMNWYNIIKPKLSMFKFRLPYNSDKTTEYLTGDIYLQAYPPISSTETRLIVGEDACMKSYSDRQFEEQMFYFNNNIRHCNFNNILLKLHPIKKNGLSNTYDGALEVYILERYIKLFNKIDKISICDKIIKMVGEITKELSKRRTLYTKQLVKPFKKKIMLRLQNDGFIPKNVEFTQNIFDIYIIPRYKYFNDLGYFDNSL
jgi:ubiquinone/menaquinone biosynthesis C-methylase UbiE